MSDEAIGMMDKAYFVGKVAIIEWLNDLLQVSLDAFSHARVKANIVCSCESRRSKSARRALCTAA